jgi:amidase
VSSSLPIDPDEIEKAKKMRADITKRVKDLLSDNTILILPTVPGIAPLVETTLIELEGFRGRAMRLLCISSLTGVPQMNLPAARLSGCPVGISLIGPPGADEILIETAQRITN